jgi:hypothetical protein
MPSPAWRPLLAASGAAGVVAVVLFVLFAVALPLLSRDSLTLPQLIEEMSTSTRSWEARNQVVVLHTAPSSISLHLHC